MDLTKLNKSQKFSYYNELTIKRIGSPLINKQIPFHIFKIITQLRINQTVTNLGNYKITPLHTKTCLLCNRCPEEKETMPHIWLVCPHLKSVRDSADFKTLNLNNLTRFNAFFESNNIESCCLFYNVCVRFLKLREKLLLISELLDS